MAAIHSNQREKEIFERALELESSGERLGYVKGVCGADAVLLARVQALLQAHDEASRFLPDAPSAEPGRTQVVDLSDDAAPGERIGRYKLLQKIGEGGCGVVYMAEQEEPVRRRVALKVIKLGMDTKSVIARFEAERQALAMMDHANIAKVLDGGATDAGRPYFVMELVRGVKITEYCEDARLSTRDRLELFITVCQAIQSAHQKGIIHRDIKPSNILVTLNDGVAVPKVIDFGIAKATEARLTDKTLFTQFEALIGTPAYMSPEQALMTSLDIDTRSDIYSLGVLLYELLAGSTPFDAKELMASGIDAMRKTIREKEPVRPSTKLSQTLVVADVRRLNSPSDTPGAEEEARASSRRLLQVKETIALLRGDLDWIVMKCLEKDRSRRYETANGLACDLQRHLDNDPVLARPPSAAYRFQKLVQRNKLAFAALSAVTLTLIAGLSLSTWAFLSEAAQRRTAVEQQSKAKRAQEAERQERLRADAEKTTAHRHLYVANMNLAQQAWEQNDVGGLRELLEETQDSPNIGFEWDYWQRQTHLALKTLRGHLQPVYSVAFSPDGLRIATGSEDHTAKVWEAASGRELFTLSGHSAPIRSVAFSPDGQRMITGSLDRTAKVWEAASSRELLTLKGHNALILSVAFSPDGRRIVTASADRTAMVWEAASGEHLLTLNGHRASINSVAFSPDGQRLVTGSADQTVKVWEAATGLELATLKGHSASISSVAFSPDGQRIAAGSEDQTAMVWQAATGRELLTFKGHSSMISSVGFSPDGQRIVTGSADQTAKMWEAAIGLELLTLKCHSDGVLSVAFSPDGQRIVTGSADQTAKVWEAKSGPELLTLKEHSNLIRSVAFSADGQRIVTCSDDRTAKVWEAASGRLLRTLGGHSSLIFSVAFSPDGQRIATGSEDQTAKVWEAATGRELLTFKGHSSMIFSVAFSPDGQRIVTGSLDKTAKVWEAATGGDLFTLKGHSGPIWAAAFCPDGQRIVTGSLDRTAKVWEAVSGRELFPLKGHGSEIWSVAFSPDGQRIVTGSQDRTAKVWDADSGTNLVTLKGHSAPVNSVAFSPDGQRIVTGSEDQSAKVWETVSARPLLTLKGHSGDIMSAAFSPDGKRIITGSADQTAKVWAAARAEQVAIWQVEERAASQSLAALERERTVEQERQRIARTRDEGAIKQWLILAPIALPTGQNGAEGLDEEQIEGEGRLRPKSGEGTIVADGEMKWQEAVLENYLIDFTTILGRASTPSVAYAVCYIWSEAEQRDLRMMVGSDDAVKAYLNGKQVYKYPFPHPFVPDQDRVPSILLSEGLNVLVFKLVNELDLHHTCKWSIRFTDAQGNPVKGIKVTLDPEAKEKTENKQP